MYVLLLLGRVLQGRLYYHVVTVRLVNAKDIDFNGFVARVSDSFLVFGLTQFAVKCFPAVSCDLAVCGHLNTLLAAEPSLQAQQVNHLHAALAVARRK